MFQFSIPGRRDPEAPGQAGKSSEIAAYGALECPDLYQHFTLTDMSTQAKEKTGEVVTLDSCCALICTRCNVKGSFVLTTLFAYCKIHSWILGVNSSLCRIQ